MGGINRAAPTRTGEAGRCWAPACPSHRALLLGPKTHCCLQGSNMQP